MQELWSIFLEDLHAFILALAGLGLLVLIGEGLHRGIGVRPALTRKIVHAGTGCFVAAFPLLFEYPVAVYILAAVFVLINGASLIGGVLSGLHPEERRSWGTVSFPLSLLIVLPFAWTPDRVYALQTAFLLLALSDPFASWIGQRKSDMDAPSIDTTSKTWQGSTAFYLSAVAVTFAAALLLNSWPQGLNSGAPLLAVVLVVPLVGTAVELLGGEGWDNLFLGVGLTVLLVVWGEHPAWTMRIVLSVLAGFVFAVTAARLEYLTLSGAAAGGLFAATLLAFGGWSWALPGFMFFFSSSVLTKVRLRVIGGDRVNSGDHRRTAPQVYANGGVAWSMIVAYALYPEPMLYWAFLGSISAAAADTWASEIGPILAREPRMITSGRRVPSGTSGAVSLAGTLAGVAGGVLIWAAAFVTATEGLFGDDPVAALGIIVTGGAVGSLADSIAGAVLQPVYKDSATAKLVEQPELSRGQPVHVQGLQWITNERVNWICTSLGAVSTAALWLAVFL